MGLLASGDNDLEELKDNVRTLRELEKGVHTPGELNEFVCVPGDCRKVSMRRGSRRTVAAC